MIKFVIAFRKPQDSATFEDRYQDFLALAERMPSLLRRQVVHVLGSPQGQSTYERLLELYFSSVDVMQAALLSPIGQEAGAELAKFPAASADMWYGDVYEA
ncbi:MAG: EthD family reductase [Anaerolineae bacterium]|nr:EthD family reductase [Anaerolineae bacterium]MDW8172679.1 EthD family reductase [Anaerolineae bacterium]